MIYSNVHDIQRVLELSLKVSTHELKSSFQHVLQMKMNKKYIFKIKICNTVNPWEAERIKRNNSYMQNVDQ